MQLCGCELVDDGLKGSENLRAAEESGADSAPSQSVAMFTTTLHNLDRLWLVTHIHTHKKATLCHYMRAIEEGMTGLCELLILAPRMLRLYNVIYASIVFYSADSIGKIY